MGLFTPRGERRDAFPMPVIPPNSAAGTVSIRSVNLHRAETALQKVAIWAAVNLIASVPEMLPYGVYRGFGVDRSEITPPQWLQDLGGEGHGLADFCWQMLYCWGLRGNVIGLAAERSPQTGQPTQIVLQHPDDVSVIPDPKDPTQIQWRVHGKEIPKSQLWHKRVFPVPGRVLGLSPIGMHAVTIGQGLHAQNFGEQWFLDGAHPSAVLTNNQQREIDQTIAKTVKERFLAAVRGTREPVVLGSGWEYQQIQIAAGESQFLETQGYTASECARIYGPGMPEILGYDTGHSMTYANIEQRAVDLLKFTLDPWLVRVERALSSLLPSQQYFEFNRKALLRADTVTRFQAHALALKNAFMTANEVRVGDESLGPVPWGDSPFLPALGPAAAAAAIKTDSEGPEDPGAPAPQEGQPV